MSTSNTAESATTPAPTKTYNLRNPMPLSAAQEAEVKQMFYKRVRSHCADEIKGVLHSFPLPISPSTYHVIHETLCRCQ